MTGAGASSDSTGGPVLPVGDPDPDQAWKVLSLVNDWIKHAETKVGATLAVTGVTGGVLYNLVKDQEKPGVALVVSSVACGVLVFLAGSFAAFALLPRLRLHWLRKEDPTNLLFFSHIARAYEHHGPTYTEVLQSLTINRNDLTRHIAHQIHANADVAHRKYKWANRALLMFLGALLALAATAVIVAHSA